LVYALDRSRGCAAVKFREARYHDLRAAIGPRSLVCMPTVPCAAPAKASNAQDRTGGYYRNALSLTSFSGISRVPQVSMPLATTATSPVGLSLIGAQGEDLFLIAAAESISRALATSGDLGKA
jgi:amidase